MSKISIELTISSPVYNDDALELIRNEIRRGMMKYLFDCIDTAPVGAAGARVGNIHHNFVIDGTIKIVD